jgi:glutamine---fructose-6-phosphate transaminase (isomerizing)
MCGIFGYIGEKNAAAVCLEGLSLLEYRGYDSAGLAGIKDRNLLSVKEIGKLKNLKALVQTKDMDLSSAIAHTRWATHGKPTIANAHPQLDENSNLAIVHNGIIENHFSLREMLKGKGVTFASDTDTEVVAQLISHHYKGNLLEAFQKTITLLKGFWAIALIHKEHPEQILVACKENPLAIGQNSSQTETYISSDVNAFQAPDLNVLFLESGEIGVIFSTSIEVFNASGAKLSKTMQKVSSNPLFISKNGFDHFMLKEIFEQPDTIRQAIHGRYIEDKGTAFFEDLSFSEKELLSFKQVLILACGTSYHAGLITANWIEELVKIPARAEIASEFRYRSSILSEGTLVIAISQSGETFDTLASVREVKERGAKILAICNAPNSTLSRDAHACIFLKAGPEISVCSTKAFSGQLAVLSLFTLLMARLRGMPEDEGKQILKDLQGLPVKIDWILRDKEKIQSLAKKYASFNNFFFLGRHYMYIASLEAALKLKEISYINAVGYPAGEMKHGPIALLDPSLAVVGLCGDETTLDKMLSNLREVKAREAPILAFAPVETPEIEDIANDTLYLPKTSNATACFVYSVAAQLFAYYVSMERGTEIDQPRNLAKSVTVE